MVLIYGLTQAWKYGPILRSQGDASLYEGLNPTPAAAAVLVVLRSLLFCPPHGRGRLPFQPVNIRLPQENDMTVF